MALSYSIVAMLALSLTLLGACDAKVSLKHLSTVYIPKAYEGDQGVFEYDVGSIEQLAYDPENHYIYAVGVNLLHVIDFRDPQNARVVDYFQFPLDGEATDTEACGDYVAVGYDNAESPLDGIVYIFKTFNGTKLELLKNITVGALPDVVKFTHHCDRLIVAIEGEVTMVDGQVTDPEGEVVILTFTDADAGYTLQRLDFTSFDADEYTKKGVRWVWHGEGAGINTTFAQDLEPEYITINKDDTAAYICLQENNAVAVVDLTVPKITEIYPMGQKHWLDYTMDPSDKDGGIHLGHWDVHSLSQPDGITLFTIGGKDYLLTGDEGDTKEFKDGDLGFKWSEVLRGEDFEAAGLIDDNVTDEMIANLKDESKLGRLEFSVLDGNNPITNKIDTFYTYGGRGISVYDVSDFSRVYSSGGIVETEIARLYPEVFNSDNDKENMTPEQAFDRRSDDNGPGPEGVEYAEIEFTEGNVSRLIFVGIEQPGFVAIFRVTDDFPGDGGVVFENILYSGGQGQTFEELWKNKKAADLDNEDVKVRPADKSPTGKPLLVVAGAVSGTMSLYEIYDAKDSKDDPSGSPGLYSNPTAVVLAGSLFLLWLRGF